jgi:hypothetical protein
LLLRASHTDRGRTEVRRCGVNQFCPGHGASLHPRTRGCGGLSACGIA